MSHPPLTEQERVERVLNQNFYRLRVACREDVDQSTHTTQAAFANIASEIVSDLGLSDSSRRFLYKREDSK